MGNSFFSLLSSYYVLSYRLAPDQNYIYYEKPRISTCFFFMGKAINYPNTPAMPYNMNPFHIDTT